VNRPLSRLRALLFQLLVSLTALLACACAGFVNEAGAAQTIRVQAPIARIATRSGARPARRSHRACATSRRRRRGRAACSARKANSSKPPTAGSHPAPRARAKGASRHAVRKTVPAFSTGGPSIASVLATPCANTELSPEPGNLEAIDTATLCLVNQERARNNELPLRPDRLLEQAAQGHSEEMISEDYFAHIAPSGLTPVERMQATGYVPNSQVGYTLGENIAWGTLQLSTPSAIVAAWIASPEHLANILYSPYRDTAIGVAPAAPASLAEGQPGAVYSQEFGVIVR
jgi:uncharacterized protein YkwD